MKQDTKREALACTWHNYRKDDLGQYWSFACVSLNASYVQEKQVWPLQLVNCPRRYISVKEAMRLYKISDWAGAVAAMKQAYTAFWEHSE